VLVYREHIEVYLNKLPTYLLMLDEGQFPTQWGSPSEKKNTHNRPQKGSVVGIAGGGLDFKVEPFTGSVGKPLSSIFTVRGRPLSSM